MCAFCGWELKAALKTQETIITPQQKGIEDATVGVDEQSAHIQRLSA
jgi:hypothetical protein